MGSSLGGLVINQVKAIVGAAGFALPVTVAAISNQPAINLPIALILSAIFVFINGYSFFSIGNACHKLGVTTYGQAFSTLYPELNQHVVTITTCGLTTGGALMSAILIGDTAQDVLVTVGLISRSYWIRAALCFSLTVFVMLPLCLLRSLKALAPYSALGVFAVSFAALFTVFRYFDGSYDVGGEFYASSHSNTGSQDVDVMAIFMVTGALSTSYVSHFTAARFLNELERPTSMRFAMMSAYAFGIAGIIMTSIMVFGYLTFRGQTVGNVIDNYSRQDYLAGFARLMMLMCVNISFPFMAQSSADDVVRLCFSDWTQSRRDIAVTIITLGVGGLASVFTKFGLVIVLTGALFGTATVFIYPSMMVMRSLKREQKIGCEYYCNLFIVCLGVLLAINGVVIGLVNQ